jgi:hypothetical protein
MDGTGPELHRWRSDAELTTAEALRALEEGELEIAGRLVEASNTGV